jgi:hypothetical protein
MNSFTRGSGSSGVPSCAAWTLGAGGGGGGGFAGGGSSGGTGNGTKGCSSDCRRSWSGVAGTASPAGSGVGANAPE